MTVEPPLDNVMVLGPQVDDIEALGAWFGDQEVLDGLKDSEEENGENIAIMGAAAKGKGFMRKSMTFRNTAGPEGEQAVALRVQSKGNNGDPKKSNISKETIKSQNILVIVADGNEKSYMTGGLVLHNCTMKMDNDLETDVDKERYEIYLG
uniref:HAT transposon superfamily n=1 Tax=Tanacetum cinerariifolium TaxID=118510 RepID=A0A6L2NEJ8_TANCI|nr:hAT transposon superfamily [Tanacetum cinerariifolium]